MKHQTWEYKRIEIPLTTQMGESEWEEVVAAGADGWELTFVTPHQMQNFQFVAYVFKRPILDPLN